MSKYCYFYINYYTKTEKNFIICNLVNNYVCKIIRSITKKEHAQSDICKGKSMRNMKIK